MFDMVPQPVGSSTPSLVADEMMPMIAHLCPVASSNTHLSVSITIGRCESGCSRSWQVTPRLGARSCQNIGVMRYNPPKEVYANGWTDPADPSLAGCTTCRCPGLGRVCG